jgi:hypothetical protein
LRGHCLVRQSSQRWSKKKKFWEWIGSWI